MDFLIQKYQSIQHTEDTTPQSYRRHRCGNKSLKHVWGVGLHRCKTAKDKRHYGQVSGCVFVSVCHG